MSDSRSYAFEELEVVGYADTLGPGLVPQRVPPIYRAGDENDWYLLPPFRSDNGRLTEYVRFSRAELDRAIVQGQATRLEGGIPASSGYSLWIDEQLEPRYAEAEDVRSELRQIAIDRARQAQAALLEADLDEAAELAQTAIAADDRCLSALLTKGLVYRLRGQGARAEMLAEIVERIAPGSDLISWIDIFAERLAYRPSWVQASVLAEPAVSWDQGYEATATPSVSMDGPLLDKQEPDGANETEQSKSRPTRKTRRKKGRRMR